MEKLQPVRFVDVALEGPFWRERLETVLTRTIPSQHVQLAAHGILESLTLPDPPPPLRFPRNHHNFTVQVFWDSDVGKVDRVPPPTPCRTAATPTSRRRSKRSSTTSNAPRRPTAT